MICREDMIYLLTRVSEETDRSKKIVGLRMLALLRKSESPEPSADLVVGAIARELGHPAGEHARGLLKTAGLA